MENKNDFLDLKQGDLATKIAKTPSLKQLLCIYKHSAESVHLRFGQWFYNNYITGNLWPELFYADTRRAIEIVEEWLVNHNYKYTTPRTLQEISNERNK